MFFYTRKKYYLHEDSLLFDFFYVLNTFKYWYLEDKYLFYCIPIQNNSLH